MPSFDTQYYGLLRTPTTLGIGTETATFPAYIEVIRSAEELPSTYYYLSLERDSRFNSADYPTEFFSEIETDLGITLVEGDVFIARPLDEGLTKQERQVMKLEIAAKKRTRDGNVRATYDITQLPDTYNDNDPGADDNANAGGLVEGRPWIEQAWTLPAGMDRNEPYNGSGGSNPTVPGAQYKTAAARGVPVYSGSGITFNDLSADALDSISNEASGLYRRKYVGKLLSTYGAWTEYLSTWFSVPSRGPISEATFEVDEYVSFGYRSDLGAENGYSLEWKGYLKAPVTGNMRFFVDVDDDIMIWIGASALAPTKDNYLLAQSGGTRSGTNGITVVAGKYYPVRMAFIEYGGAEQFQIFANSSAGATVYNGQDLDWAHNTATKGY